MQSGCDHSLSANKNYQEVRDVRLPFFGNKSEPMDNSPLQLTLPAQLEIQWVVYFHRPVPALPTQQEVARLIQHWLQTHAEPPLSDAVAQWLDNGMLMFHIATPAEIPTPPIEHLREFGLGEQEEQRFRQADGVVVVRSVDRLSYPRFGLWAGLAAARSLAHALQGVILDPATRQVLPLNTYGKSLPTDILLAITEHAIVYNSINQRGMAYCTLEGMGKFGLPNIELRDAPPGLIKQVNPILYGLGSLLTFQAMEHIQKLGDSVDSQTDWQVGPELRLGAPHIAYALGRKETPPAPGMRGWADVRLEYVNTGRGTPGMLRLIPPRSYAGGIGEWLYALASDFTASEDTVQAVKGDNETVEEAHRRAMAELPRIKARFQSGLLVGETLYVKQGFPVASGNSEYLWIVVNTWQRDTLQGQISNNSQMRPDLRAGQSVQLQDSDIFDWMVALPSGQMEGGYTTRALMQEANR